MKRKLKDKELAMAIKGLNAKKEEAEWLNYQIAYYNLMLDKGLEMNHLKNVRDFKKQKKEYVGELELVKNVINILQDQIRNGVEKKEMKDKKGKEIKLEKN